MTTPLTIRVDPGQTFFGVRFRPGMAAAFLRPAGLFNDRIEPLANLWGAAAKLLYEQLAAASKPAEMAATAESFLRPYEPPDPAQRALWSLSTTRLTLDQLASDAGLSARTLRRVCIDRAGVSPKYLRRILRFRKTAERIRAVQERGAQPSWAQMAAACGYHDQAHFIREFQEFSGSTPGRFLQYASNGSPSESQKDE